MATGLAGPSTVTSIVKFVAEVQAAQIRSVVGAAFCKQGAYVEDASHTNVLAVLPIVAADTYGGRLVASLASI
jgi:hypothetical protein